MDVLNVKTAASTKESGSTTKDMASAVRQIVMGQSMKANGLKTRGMEMENYTWQMGL